LVYHGREKKRLSLFGKAGAMEMPIGLVDDQQTQALRCINGRMSTIHVQRFAQTLMLNWHTAKRYANQERMARARLETAHRVITTATGLAQRFLQLMRQPAAAGLAG
jgi:hypothetical protein